MRIASMVVLLALLSGERVRAQESDSVRTQESDSVRTQESDSDIPWRTSFFPYLTGGANDGPVLAFRVHHFQAAEYEDRVVNNASITGEAGFTSRGSRYIVARFRAPQLWNNWRLKALAAAGREARFGYFGIGNETVKNDDLSDKQKEQMSTVNFGQCGD